MPEVARFYGIVIKLFFGDHPPTHFHEIYGEYVGLFNIDTLEQMWDNQEFHKLQPLD